MVAPWAADDAAPETLLYLGSRTVGKRPALSITTSDSPNAVTLPSTHLFSERAKRGGFHYFTQALYEWRWPLSQRASSLHVSRELAESHVKPFREKKGCPPPLRFAWRKTLPDGPTEQRSLTPEHTAPRNMASKTFNSFCAPYKFWVRMAVSYAVFHFCNVPFFPFPVFCHYFYSQHNWRCSSCQKLMTYFRFTESTGCQQHSRFHAVLRGHSHPLVNMSLPLGVRSASPALRRCRWFVHRQVTALLCEDGGCVRTAG